MKALAGKKRALGIGTGTRRQVPTTPVSAGLLPTHGHLGEAGAEGKTTNDWQRGGVRAGAPPRFHSSTSGSGRRFRSGELVTGGPNSRFWKFGLDFCSFDLELCS